MASPLDKKKPSPAWEPPPLDWRKFDDPCSPRSREKKLKNRLGRKDLLVTAQILNWAGRPLP